MEITLSITEERFAKIREIANSLHITPEDLVRVSIDGATISPG